MKLTVTAIETLNNSQSRMRLALTLGVTERAIMKWLKENRKDGQLTKVGYVKAISELTGLSESEILTEEELQKVG